MSTLTEVNMPRAIPKLERREVMDRMLFSITGLRQREALSALMLAANVFLLLGSYYVLKTVRVSPSAGHRKGGQDPRKQRGLLRPEYGAPCAVPPVQPRSQVQGQGGHRHLFLARGRRPSPASCWPEHTWRSPCDSFLW
jgi:hypothetical protein